MRAGARGMARMNWPALSLIPAVLIYLLLMALLAIYVLSTVYLSVISIRSRGRAPRRSDPPPPAQWPPVTVQLPLYNEAYVAARLVASVAELDYPPGLLQIQVLDDSTDETVVLVANEVERQRGRGLDVVHLRRDHRRGFKAGALADGLATATGEYIAVFDADFLPRPDFLRRMIPRFTHNRVAFVQARWGHLNPDYSLLTMLQALSLDAHFAIDQQARSSAGLFFNFNGTAGIWRKEAIVDAGGWRADTLTEDLDLSYRAFLRGWKAAYVEDVEASGELPVSFSAFRRQQRRWAGGSLECAVQHLPRIWRAPFGVKQKIAASLHLTAYLTHVVTLGLMLIFPVLLSLAAHYPTLLDPVGPGVAANLLFFVPSAYFILGQHLLGRRWLRRVPLIFMMTIAASGLMLNTFAAALQVLRRQVVPFERTPKYGILRRGQDWRKNHYRARTDPIAWLEAALGGFGLWTSFFALQTGHWLIMTYSLLLAAGLLLSSGFSLLGPSTRGGVPRLPA